METQLWESVKRLEQLNPHFVSVTYGAGGSTRERTHAMVLRIAHETHMKPAAHLTCVSSTQEETDRIIRAYWEAGVRHIVALRGDPPGGVGSHFMPHPLGYPSSSHLVRGIKAIADFEISVSTYPEGHPESRSIDQDIDALKAKIDAGATRAITQFFFENEVYLRFLERARARGITIPIVPGIMPVRNFKQVAGFAKKAGASVPDGSPTASMGSRTITRRMRSSPQRRWSSRSWISSGTASTSSTSIRTIAPISFSAFVISSACGRSAKRLTHDFR